MRGLAADEHRRLEWDVPDTPGNAAASGYAGAGPDRSAFPKARVVTVSECASHAVADAEIAGKGAGEQSLARKLYGRLAEDWLLIADRNFCNWADWCTAADCGAALLWRVKSDLRLPMLELLPQAPDLPQGHQASPPQLLPRQTSQRPGYPQRWTANHNPRQPAHMPTRGMINLR